MEAKLELKERYQWLEEILPKEIAAKAVCRLISPPDKYGAKARPERLKKRCSKDDALIAAFDFTTTEEGFDYWSNVYRIYFQPRAGIEDAIDSLEAREERRNKAV